MSSVPASLVGSLKESRKGKVTEARDASREQEVFDTVVEGQERQVGVGVSLGSHLESSPRQTRVTRRETQDRASQWDTRHTFRPLECTHSQIHKQGRVAKSRTFQSKDSSFPLRQARTEVPVAENGVVTGKQLGSPPTKSRTSDECLQTHLVSDEYA